MTERLPTIVRFFEPIRSEPGQAECPHCGARGATIHRFQVEDGRQLGAMSGCVKLFPLSPIANEDLRLRTKVAGYARQGRRLSSWDLEKRAAIDAFYEGAIDLAAATARIATANASAARFRACRRRTG